MPQTLRLCQFQFQDVDIRRVGQTADGGTSLSGISDVVEADGGGYWRADYQNGFTRTAADGLAWRQVTDIGLANSVDLCLEHERLFGPGIIGSVSVAASPLTSGSELPSSTAYLASAAPLRSTALTITTASGSPALASGMIFSILHATWGWRAYRLETVAGQAVTIRPPLREAISSNTPLDFNYPRCRMRLLEQPSNPTSLGRLGVCNVSFVEDMRQPS